jgi:hypothetical protein
VPASRAPAYVLGGAGILALTGAATLAVLGHVERLRLEHDCSPHCSPDQADPITTMWLVAGGLGAGGAVLLGTAWLLWPRTSSTPLSVAVTPTGAFLHGTF